MSKTIIHVNDGIDLGHYVGKQGPTGCWAAGNDVGCTWYLADTDLLDGWGICK